MKALTIRQPWATLIATGVKTIETRTRPTNIRGRIAIHAGKSLDTPGGCRSEDQPEWTVDDAWRFGVHDGYDGGILAWRGDRRHPVEALFTDANLPLMTDLPLGAVIATAELVDCLPIIGKDECVPVAWQPHIAPTGQGALWQFNGPSDTESLCTGRPTWRTTDITAQRPYGDFTPGRWAWLLADVHPLDEPMPAKGSLGWWEWTP